MKSCEGCENKGTVQTRMLYLENTDTESRDDAERCTKVDKRNQKRQERETHHDAI